MSAHSVASSHSVKGNGSLAPTNKFRFLGIFSKGCMHWLTHRREGRHGEPQTGQTVSHVDCASTWVDLVDHNLPKTGVTRR